MDNAFQYMDIIFLAIIAGLVLLRLRSVLGKRTGSEKKDPNQFSYDQPIKQSPTAKDKVINIKDKITHKSEWFNSDDFLEGANAAYETIVTNFENGNLKTLKPLLDQEVLKSFTTVVDQRKQDQQNVEFSFIGIDSSEIIYKDLNSVPMEVTVRFVSEMITCIKNTKDEVISGSLNQVQKITDVWTFTKDKKIKSNNWLLAATSD
ncbi:MAG: Tim44/TimA family putative adaptor protein [Candidatus Pelagibacterales bacterium]|jgi:predicted lipid-binding transport protein (Tim44 family)|tara:strand:- start:6380 stop:6994 length:615 start_codon:yes stop_codon:yes gene_type:complete